MTKRDPAAQQLRSFVERIERLEEEIKGLNTDKRDIYAEAKGSGFDVKALRTVVGIRRKDSAELQEHNAIVGLYLDTLGMAVDLPEPSRVHVHPHAREEEPFDPETGEIGAQRGAPSAAEPGADEGSATHQELGTAVALYADATQPPAAEPREVRAPLYVMPGTRINAHTGLPDLDEEMPPFLRRGNAA